MSALPQSTNIEKRWPSSPFMTLSSHPGAVNSTLAGHNEISYDERLSALKEGAEAADQRIGSSTETSEG